MDYDIARAVKIQGKTLDQCLDSLRMCSQRSPHLPPPPSQLSPAPSKVGRLRSQQMME